MTKQAWLVVIAVIAVVGLAMWIADSCKVEASRPVADRYGHAKAVSEGEPIPDWSKKPNVGLLYQHRNCLPDETYRYTEREVTLPLIPLVATTTDWAISMVPEVATTTATTTPRFRGHLPQGREMARRHR